MAYRYFFSMREAESHSESEFYYPEEEEEAKTEENNMANVATHGEENSSNCKENISAVTSSVDGMARFVSVHWTWPWMTSCTRKLKL